MITKVLPYDVRYRTPYFVECAFCKTKIFGQTPDEVAQKAQEEGWRYLTENDIFVCGECFKQKEDTIRAIEGV